MKIFDPDAPAPAGGGVSRRFCQLSTMILLIVGLDLTFRTLHEIGHGVFGQLAGAHWDGITAERLAGYAWFSYPLIERKEIAVAFSRIGGPLVSILLGCIGLVVLRKAALVGLLMICVTWLGILVQNILGVVIYGGTKPADYFVLLTMIGLDQDSIQVLQMTFGSVLFIPLLVWILRKLQGVLDAGICITFLMVTIAAVISYAVLLSDAAAILASIAMLVCTLVTADRDLKVAWLVAFVGIISLVAVPQMFTPHQEREPHQLSSKIATARSSEEKRILAFHIQNSLRHSSEPLDEAMEVIRGLLLDALAIEPSWGSRYDYAQSLMRSADFMESKGEDGSAWNRTAQEMLEKAYLEGGDETIEVVNALAIANGRVGDLRGSVREWARYLNLMEKKNAVFSDTIYRHREWTQVMIDSMNRQRREQRNPG